MPQFLDLGLPDGDGLDLLAELRPAGNHIPILILTARDAVEQRVLGLDAGRMTTLVKPFAMSELIARTKALLRRPGAALGTTLKAGNIVFDTIVETPALPACRCNSRAAKLRFWSTCCGDKGGSSRRAFSKRNSTASTPSWNRMPFRCTCITYGASCRRLERARRFIPCAALAICSLRRKHESWRLSLVAIAARGAPCDLYVVAAAIAVGILVYQAYETAGSLNDRELDLRAEDLAHAMVTDSAGQPRLDLPSKLAAAYAAAPEDDLFAIRDANGRVIAASPAEFGERVAKWPPAKSEPSYFRLSGVGPEEVGENYYGLNVALQTSAGPMWISVARTEGSDSLVKSLLREFVFDTMWVIPILMLATLGIGVVVIRNGLKPVREISQKAASIGPDATSVRLPEQSLPTEIQPLVVSINRALDRLEKGFAVQREFTRQCRP